MLGKLCFIVRGFEMCNPTLLFSFLLQFFPFFHCGIYSQGDDSYPLVLPLQCAPEGLPSVNNDIFWPSWGLSRLELTPPGAALKWCWRELVYKYPAPSLLRWDKYLAPVPRISQWDWILATHSSNVLGRAPFMGCLSSLSCFLVSLLLSSCLSNKL